MRESFLDVKNKRPYQISAVAILPKHLHCVLTLPEGDSDFSSRWGLIKAYFSHHIEKSEAVSKSREKRGERGIYPMNWGEGVDVSDIAAGE